MRTTAGPSARTVNLAHLAVIRTTGSGESLRTPRGDSFCPSFRSIRTANTTRSLPAGAWPIEPLAFDPPHPVVTAREAFNRSRKAWPVQCAAFGAQTGAQWPCAPRAARLGRGREHRSRRVLEGDVHRLIPRVRAPPPRLERNREMPTERSERLLLKRAVSCCVGPSTRARSAVAARRGRLRPGGGSSGQGCTARRMPAR